jgi:hypothetical protein
MSKKTKQSLAETPKNGSINRNYFFRMMSPEASRIAKPYENEEGANLKQLVASLPDIKKMNFIVVGAGTLWYLELAFKKAKQYIAIEPLSRVFVKKQFRFLTKQFKNISIVEKEFGKVKGSDIPLNNQSLYVFIFNILAYIERPIKNINKLLKKGDVLYISTWAKTKKAKKLRKEYFDYLNSFEKNNIIDPEKTIGLCHLDNFPFHKLKYYKKHKRIKGKIVDILIIYT